MKRLHKSTALHAHQHLTPHGHAPNIHSIYTQRTPLLPPSSLVTTPSPSPSPYHSLSTSHPLTTHRTAYLSLIAPFQFHPSTHTSILPPLHQPPNHILPSTPPHPSQLTNPNPLPCGIAIAASHRFRRTKPSPARPIPAKLRTTAARRGEALRCRPRRLVQTAMYTLDILVRFFPCDGMGTDGPGLGR